MLPVTQVPRGPLSGDHHPSNDSNTLIVPFSCREYVCEPLTVNVSLPWVLIVPAVRASPSPHSICA